MSPEKDTSRRDRRALIILCFDLTVALLIAGERFTESNSVERFNSYTGNRHCVFVENRMNKQKRNEFIIL